MKLKKRASVPSLRNTIMSHSMSEDVVIEKSWKHIIFLIFSTFWIISIDINIFLNGIMILYYLIFMEKFPLTITIIYYAFEFHYAIDTILSILHIKWEKVRKRRFFDSKHIGVLILNVMTLLPFFEVYYLLVPPEQTPIKDYFRSKCMLRYIILSMHLHSTDASINRFNQLIIVTIKQLFLLNTSVMVLCSIWYQISWKQWKKSYLFRDRSHHHNFQVNNTFHWFVVSYTKTLNILIQNIYFGFHWDDTLEYFVMTMILIFGFNIQMVVFVAKLISAHIHRQLMYFAFKLRMKATDMMLEDLNVDLELRQKAVKYCDKLWTLRYGNLTTPASFRMLPISLQKDISNDIFWDALQHSQLFERVNMSLRRVISLKMKNVFLMPGSYLYRKGQMKSQMIYIVSGNVQVLSSEDNKSPILNFTCGTILGEINTLISTKSAVNVYTATGCTVHILDLPDLFYAIAQSKYTSTELKRNLNKRIKLVKEMRVIKQKMVKAYETMEDKYNTPIKKLKTNWRTVWNMGLSRKEWNSKEILNQYDITYCSKFLDLLVMTESLGSDVQVNSICIRNTCPFVMEPNSSFRNAIFYLSLGCTLVNAMILPFCVCFLNELPRILFSLCLLLDLVCWFDLYCELITAIKSPTVTVTQPIEIFLRKIKTPRFFVDFLSALPIDFIVFWHSTNLMYASFCRLNRLIRIYRIYIIVQKWDESITGNVTVKKVCKYTIYYISAIYFTACLLYSNACPGICSKYSWFRYNMGSEGRMKNATIIDRFIVSLNLSCSIILRCHFTKILSYDLNDILLFSAIGFLGYMLYAFCISECACYGLQLSLIKNVYEERFKTLSLVLKKANMSQNFIKFVIEHLEFNIFNERFSSDLNKNDIELSKDLKNEIDRTRIITSLQRVEIFKMLSEDILMQIAKNVKILGVQENSVVISAGMISPWIHILEKGECIVYSSVAEMGNTVISILYEGMAFPVVETILHLPSLITVETKTNCQIMYIPADRFLLILEIYHERYLFDLKNFESIINYINLLECDLENENDDIQYINRAKKALFFQSTKSQAKEFGRVAFLRYLMLRNTFHPESKFYLTWEVVRCLLAVVQLIINANSLTLLYKYSDIVFICNIVLDVTGYIDMYVRLHVQYYNDKQILVTHPFYTARHYIMTSFIVDLYGILPYYIFKLHVVFFKNTLLTYYLHTVGTRTMQLWRVFGGLNYLMSISKDKKLAVLRTIKIILIYFISEMLFLNYLLAKVCVFDEAHIDCSSYDLFKSNPAKGRNSYYIKTTICYLVVAFFTGTSSTLFRKLQVKQLTDYYLLLIAMLTLRIYLMTYYIAILVAGHFSAIANRNRVKNFMDFAKKENVDDETFAAVVKEYEHRWKQTNGLDFIKELDSMQYEIRFKLMDFLFGRRIASVPLFADANERLIRLLTINVKIDYFLRDSLILKKNDVHNRLYIVYKGIVEINIDEFTVLEVLGRGSIFGSFAKRGYTRQTINARAITHCELLYINADVFNRLIAQCPLVLRRIKQVRFLNQEYVLNTNQDDSKSEDVGKAWLKQSKHAKINAAYNSWSMRINRRFDQNSFWMKQLMYIFYMHYTPLTILITIVVFVHMKCGNVSVLSLLITNYVMDIAFWIRVLANLTLQYADKDTGQVIVDPAKIRRRYIHSYGFLLDIFILVPFEAFIYIFSVEYAFIGLLPRCFRVVHFYIYYASYRSTFNYESHICIFFYVYFNLTYVSVFSGMWVQLSCTDPCCFPEKRATEGRDCRLVAWKMLLNGLIFSVNMISGCNIKVPPPDDTTKINISLGSNFTAPFVVAIMLCSITNIFNTCYFNQMKYFRTMDELIVNLKKQDLSQALLQKTIKFFNVMWNSTRGESMPLILKAASPSLRETIMMNIYGNHLQNHYLFADTHIDFIRQVVATMEKSIYLPGYQIVRQGDFDGCMYFVNSGEVESKTLMRGGENKTMYVLHPGNSFGEGSGLFNVAHQHTYVCSTVAEVLVLKRDKWSFLWKWFPASYEIMLLKAREFQIDGCYQQPIYASFE